MAVARGKISRRTLIKGGLAVGAGLVVGFEIAPGRRTAVAQQTPGLFTPNQWITIDRDGLVTIVNSVVEMGQGSLTTMPMIVADELDAIKAAHQEAREAHQAGASAEEIRAILASVKDELEAVRQAEQRLMNAIQDVLTPEQRERWCIVRQHVAPGPRHP